MRNPAFVIAPFAALATWVKWDLAGDFVLAAGAIIFAILFIGWTLHRTGRGSRSCVDRRH
jgi:hypothetical protein